MKVFLRRSRFDLGQMLLLVLAAALAWLLFAPWIQRETRLLNDFLSRKEFARNTAALKESSAELSRNLSQLREQISLFSSGNESMRGVEIVEIIRKTAMKTGVVLTGIESAGERSSGGVVTYGVKAQARGTYDQIGLWAAQCMREYPHLKIQSLSVKRNGIGAGPNLAQVEFAFCFPQGPLP